MLFLQGMYQCTAVTSFYVKPYNLIHMAASLDIYVEERVWCRSALLLCTEIQYTSYQILQGSLKMPGSRESARILVGSGIYLVQC